MNKIPLMDVQRQYKVHKNGIDKRIKKVLESGNFIMSEEVKIFEKNLCDFHNVKNAITVGNGTDALVIALKSIGIKPGDEVIVPAMSFFATSEAVIQAGAKVVFADINKDDFTIDVIEVEKHINERTKAIIPVHLYGKLSNMDDLMSLANKHNIFVIEDACQAIGATINNVKAGAYGHLACISFFPTKNLGAYGDGGLILTNDDILATRARALRVHGSGKNGVESYSFFNENNDSLELNDEFMEYHDTKYNNSIIGFNSRLDEIQAAILDYKLNYLNQWNQRRIEIAKIYSEKINNKNVFIPKYYSDNTHVYYVFPLIVEKRKEFREYLEKNNISTGIYFPIPLHLQPAHSDLKHKYGDFPNAEWLSLNSVTIPIFPELTNEEIDYIVDVINKF